MPAPLGLWMAHTWHADLSRTHTFAKNMRAFMRLCARVSPPTCMCVHVCVQTSPRFQCVNTREGPLHEGVLRSVSGWEPSAYGELIWGQGLGREASGCLSTPGGRWNRQHFLGKLMRMSCRREPNRRPESKIDDSSFSPLANEARHSITGEEIKLVWHSLLFPKPIRSLLCSALCTSGWCLIEHLVYREISRVQPVALTTP